MKREVPVEELQRLYGPEDMVRADCGGCAGCHLCCTDMGDSVILEPMDLFRLEKGLNRSFSELLESGVELGVCGGLILPHLRMDGQNSSCSFLDPDTGRCTIHSLRPDLCRIFPLGRIYTEQGFRYYLQKSQCPRTGRRKIKVKKWIDIPECSGHEEYVLKWHHLKKKMTDKLEITGDESLKREINLFFLNLFYGTSYDSGEDFYGQFHDRVSRMEQLLHAISW